MLGKSSVTCSLPRLSLGKNSILGKDAMHLSGYQAAKGGARREVDGRTRLGGQSRAIKRYEVFVRGFSMEMQTSGGAINSIIKSVFLTSCRFAVAIKSEFEKCVNTGSFDFELWE